MASLSVTHNSSLLRLNFICP
uniref:Uncharacterized protein n=1 Tax=Anguilla anguilla TaxID=7936 RepID=A0A0E9S3F0_ANGAN